MSTHKTHTYRTNSFVCKLYHETSTYYLERKKYLNNWAVSLLAIANQKHFSNSFTWYYLPLNDWTTLCYLPIAVLHVWVLTLRNCAVNILHTTNLNRRTYIMLSKHQLISPLYLHLPTYVDKQCWVSKLSKVASLQTPENTFVLYGGKTGY